MASKRTHDEAFAGPADDAAPQARLPRATQEIVTYFEELKSHFDGLDDKEEQSLLVANALEEASGQECAVATDPACSRVLEALLPAAEPQQIAKFFQAVLKGEGLMAMASSPFGAHVLEAVLEQLTNAQQDAALEGPAIEELLTEACNNVCEHLYDFLTNRYATHVARRLLCIIAGRNVLPLAAKSQNKKSKGGALASKVGLLPGKQAATPEVAYPDLLHVLVDTLLSSDYISALHELMYDQHASPFIQGILTACEGNGEALQALIPAMLGAQPDAEEGDDSLLQGITRTTFQGIMQDRLSSHVMEVVFAVAPQPLLEEFYSSFLSSDLPALAAHPSANFALQAFLAAANRSPLVKTLLAELKGSFKELLQRRRSGVVAALLAACARTSAGQADASKAIAAALTGLHDEGKGLAETLLTLDMPGRICGPDMKPGQRVRLSPLGCAMLTTLLSFPQEFSQAFVSSIGDWSPSETLRVGQDPGGSRVLEALVNAAAASKAKKKLLRKLKGMWAILAVEPGGNHVVESCFIWGGVKDKEVIAGELASAEASLSGTPRGAALMRKCGTSAFKSSSSDWKRKATADAQTLNESQLYVKRQLGKMSRRLIAVSFMHAKGSARVKPAYMKGIDLLLDIADAPTHPTEARFVRIASKQYRRDGQEGMSPQKS
ncbi:hypothetical protein WJX82_002725 [Trebouxia sp. C0006]